MKFLLRPHKATALMLLAALVFVLVFTGLNLMRYKARFSFEWGDEAVHNQLAWRTYRVGLFTSTLKGQQVFDQHFRPIWAVVALPYLIVPHIGSWYFLQSLAFAGAAVLLFFWLRKRTDDPWGALIFGLVFLCYPPLHQLAVGVYDPEKLVIFFWAAALFALAHRRFGWFAACLFGALCCKEIVGFTMILFGASLLFTVKEKRYGLLALGLAVCWLTLAYGLVIPATMSEGYGSKYFPQLLGSDCQSAGCVITHAVTHPLKTLGVLFSFEHIRILALLLPPLGLLSFGAPMIALPAAACLSMILIVPGPMLVGQHHWFAPAVVFLIFAAAAGAFRLAEKFSGGSDVKTRQVFRSIGIAVLVLCFTFSIFGGFVGRFHTDPRDDSQYENLSSPFDKRIYQMDDLDHKAWKLIRQIPKEAAVTANYDLMAPLATRKTIYEFGRNARNYDYFQFDYILINLVDRYFGAGHDVRIHPNDLERLMQDVSSGDLIPLFVNQDFFFGKRKENGMTADQMMVPSAMLYLQNAAKVAAAKLNEQGFEDIRD